jgi:hypothetical protein
VEFEVPTQADVRTIALSLPGVHEDRGRFAFGVEKSGKLKGFAWVWLERLAPKKPRVPQPKVLAVRVRDQAEKATLIAGDPRVFFTEPHYDGFPAVLVRLPVVTKKLLRKLIVDAWECQSPGPKKSGGARAKRAQPKLARRGTDRD